MLVTATCARNAACSGSAGANAGSATHNGATGLADVTVAAADMRTTEAVAVANTVTDTAAMPEYTSSAKPGQHTNALVVFTDQYGTCTRDVGEDVRTGVAPVAGVVSTAKGGDVALLDTPPTLVDTSIRRSRAPAITALSSTTALYSWDRNSELFAVGCTYTVTGLPITAPVVALTRYSWPKRNGTQEERRRQRLGKGNSTGNAAHGS